MEEVGMSNITHRNALKKLQEMREFFNPNLPNHDPGSAYHDMKRAYHHIDNAICAYIDMPDYRPRVEEEYDRK